MKTVASLCLFTVVLVIGCASAAPRARCTPPKGTSSFEFRSEENVLRGFVDAPKVAPDIR